MSLIWLPCVDLFDASRQVFVQCLQPYFLTICTLAFLTHDLFWEGQVKFTSCEAPNELAMRRGLLKREHLDRYRARRRSHHIYAAAAKLWSHGVEWEKALAIINEAFDAATFEEWRIMSCQRISNLHKEKEKNLHGQHKMHCKRLLLFHVDIDPGCDSKSYGLVGVPKYFLLGE